MSAESVSNIDFAPTLVDAARADPHGPFPPGPALADVLSLVDLVSELTPNAAVSAVAPAGG